MPYIKRPFNPLISIENQVISELEQANHNFEALANVFVNEDPINGKVKRAQLSDNAINSQYAVNSDMVDGFHASLTPAPNRLIPLNSFGFLDLSSTYIKSSIYTFRRVGLTGASVDYEMQIGEEAYIGFNSATSVPVRIRFSFTGLYEVFIRFFNNTNTNDFTFLNPNHTTYDRQFSHVSVYWSSAGGSGFGTFTEIDNAFRLFSQTPHAYMIIDRFRNIIQGIASFEYGTNGIGIGLFTSKWTPTMYAWSSFGTFTFPVAMSGYIIIRRLD
jgi:hypothetical protein